MNYHSLTRDDVIAAYEMILGRQPESEEVISHQLAICSDRRSLGLRMLSSAEADRRQLNVPEHHIYRGYSPEDLFVLDAFEAYKGTGTPGYVTNFLGCKYRTTFSTSLAPYDGAVEDYPRPLGGFQGETAEFIGVLRSVLENTRGKFRILECGAGYGTWMGVAYAAARQKKIGDIKLYGIEGDEGHYAFLRQYMSDNAIDNHVYTAIYGAIGVNSGKALWARVDDPSAVYGGRPLANDLVDYHGQHQERSVEVTIYALRDILIKEELWDVMHVDIQGGEADLCEGGIDVLNERVRRIVIGTHSRSIDGDVMRTFHKAGWSLENEKPTIASWRDGAPTLETMTIVDGVQVWRNPRLSA